MNRLLLERERIIEVGIKLGMRRSHIEMISSEEEEEDGSGDESDKDMVRPLRVRIPEASWE
jgi:hypothetical protein